MVYICTKFHVNILNGIRVMGGTPKVNRQMDRNHHIIQSVFDEHIKIQNVEIGLSKESRLRLEREV